MTSSPPLRNHLIGTFGAAFVATAFASWGAISLSVGALGQGVMAGVAAMCFALVQTLNARSLWLGFQRIPNVARITFALALVILPLMSGVVARYFLIRADVGRTVAQTVFEDAPHPLFAALAGMAAQAAFVWNGIITAVVGSFLIVLMVGTTPPDRNQWVLSLVADPRDATLEEAVAIWRKLYAICPNDNLGVRFLIEEYEATGDVELDDY